jgi:hypothetical protein
MVLLPSARLNQRYRRSADGRSTMQGVPWPADQPRVHFTVVSVQDGRVRVGRTATLSRTSAVQDVRLVERVDWQLLTFDWPHGAAMVQVHLTASGEELGELPERPVAQLDAAAYKAQGGLRLQGLLPSRGCDLLLVPVSFYEGRKVHGTPARVIYPGLLQLRYRLLGDAGAFKGSVLKRLGRLTLEVRSDQQVRQSPPLVLVHNPDRLPLDLHDGEPLLRVSGPLAKDDWVVLKDFQLERDRKGWLRLFVDWDRPGPGVAVLDPPVSTLRR